MNKPALLRAWHGQLELFATRPFLAMTTGGLLSAAGSSAASVTLIWFVLSQTHSPALVSILFACYFGARIIAQACTGIIVDRFERGQIMVLGDLLSGLFFIGVSILSASQVFRFELFVLSYLFIGIFSQLYPVSAQSALPDVIPQQHMVRANAAMQASIDIGGLIGPASGAILLTTIGPTWAFAANALSFFLSAAITITGHIRSHPDHQPQPLISDFIQGLQSLLSSRILTILCIIGLVIHIVVIPTETVLISSLVKNVFHAPVLTYGIAITCLSIGSLACGIILSLIHIQLSPTRMLLIGCIAEGFSVIGLGLSPFSWSLWIMALLYGAAGALLFAYVLTVVQENTLPALRGRTFSTLYLGVETGSVIGLIVAGPLIAQWGPRYVLIGLGILVLLTIPLLALVQEKKATQTIIANEEPFIPESTQHS